MSLEKDVGRALTQQLGVRVNVSATGIEKGRYTVSSPAFDKLRGVSLLVTRPYANRLVGKASFGPYATYLVNSWGAMDGERVSCALKYLRCFDDRLDIIARGGDIDLRDDDRSVEAIRGLTTPADFTLRVSKTIREVDYDALSEVAQCAFGFLLMLSGVISDEDEPQTREPEFEGAERHARLTYHERSRVNRALCLAAHGHSCSVCGMDFESTYGSFASGYIEVHHLHPISGMDKPRRIDPIAELVPLCPNCHAAVHLEDPPIPPDRLRRLMHEK